MIFKLWSSSNECFDVERPNYEVLQQAVSTDSWDRLMTSQNHLIIGLQQYLTLNELLSGSTCPQQKEHISAKIEALAAQLCDVQNQQRAVLESLYERRAVNHAVRIVSDDGRNESSQLPPFRLQLVNIVNRPQGNTGSDPAMPNDPQFASSTPSPPVPTALGSSSAAPFAASVDECKRVVVVSCPSADTTALTVSAPLSDIRSSPVKRPRGRPRKLASAGLGARNSAIMSLRHRPHRTRQMVAAELSKRALAETAGVCLLKQMSASAGKLHATGANSANQEQLCKKAKHVHMSLLGLVPVYNVAKQHVSHDSEDFLHQQSQNNVLSPSLDDGVPTINTNAALCLSLNNSRSEMPGNTYGVQAISNVVSLSNTNDHAGISCSDSDQCGSERGELALIHTDTRNDSVAPDTTVQISGNLEDSRSPYEDDMPTVVTSTSSVALSLETQASSGATSPVSHCSDLGSQSASNETVDHVNTGVMSASSGEKSIKS